MRYSPAVKVMKTEGLNPTPSGAGLSPLPAGWWSVGSAACGHSSSSLRTTFQPAAQTHRRHIISKRAPEHPRKAKPSGSGVKQTRPTSSCSFTLKCLCSLHCLANMKKTPYLRTGCPGGDWCPAWFPAGSPNS